MRQTLNRVIIAIVIAISMIIWVKPMNAWALTAVVHEYSVSPNQPNETSTVADGSTYRFIVEIDDLYVKNGWTYANDGYAYIIDYWQVKPGTNGQWTNAVGSGYGDFTWETEKVTENNQLGSLRWQTPDNILDGCYTILVHGRRFYYRGEGGGGEPEPWNSTWSEAVSIDLDIPGVLGADELDPVKSGFVPVNNNDSDNNGTEDKEQSNLQSGDPLIGSEYDFLALRLREIEPYDKAGDISVQVTEGSGSIVCWTEKDKVTAATSYHFDTSDDEDKYIWVEGKSHTEPGAVKIRITSQGAEYDEVALTVFGTDVKSGSTGDDTKSVILPGEVNDISYILYPSNFEATSVTLRVRDKNNNEVRACTLSERKNGATGYAHTTWDGKDNDNNFLSPDGNPYKLIVDVERGGGHTWGVKTDVKVPKADIDTDSDNDGSINGNEAEENVEAVDPEPGKIIGCGDEAASHAEVSLSHDPATGAENCQVKLITSNGNIKVWDQNRSQIITSENVWTMSNHPPTVYVEGISVGQADLSMVLLTPDKKDEQGQDVPGHEFYRDTVRFTVSADIDVDSSNNNNYYPYAMDRSDQKEAIENVTGDNSKPGKMVGLSNMDSDGDGIPDYADGFDNFADTDDDLTGNNQCFAPVVLELSSAANTSQTQVKITCSEIASATAERSGTPPQYTYVPPSSGSLRLWTKSGGTARDKASVADDGDYVPGNIAIPAAKLGFIPDQNNLVTLFLEGTKASTGAADKQIKVEVDPKGSNVWKVEDMVRVTIIEGDLDTDSDNNTNINDADEAIEMYTPGKLLGCRTAGTELGRVDVSFKPDIAEVFNGTKVQYGKDNSNIKLWKIDDQGGKTEISTDDSWTITTSTNVVPKPIYVEGLSLGTSNLTMTLSRERLPGIYEMLHYDKVVFTIPLDMDIDSENSGVLDRSDLEENMEDTAGDITQPGKIAAINDNDSDDLNGDGTADGDGIPDYADGFNLQGDTDADNQCQGEQFIPVKIELANCINVNTAQIRFEYEPSIPGNASRSGVPPRYIYKPAEVGKIRLWAENGDATRNKDSINSDGDFIPANEGIDVTKLGFSQEVRVVTLYAEAVKPSTGIGDIQIKVHVAPKGQNDFALADAIRLTVLAADIDTDSDDNGQMEDDKDDPVESLVPGKLIVIGEEDPYLVNLKVSPNGLTGYGAELSGGGGYIKVWNNAQKQTQITLPIEYSTGSIPSSVYVEGIKPGDTSLTLALKSPLGTVLHSDTIALSVNEEAEPNNCINKDSCDECDDPYVCIGVYGQCIVRGPGIIGSDDGDGEPIIIEPVYNSKVAERDGLLGKGWTLNYSMRIAYATDQIIRMVNVAGQLYTFRSTGGGTYRADSSSATIVKNGDGSYTLTETDGVKYNFDIYRRLVSIVNSNGHTNTVSYGGDGKISGLTDANGRGVSIGYSGGYISSVTDIYNRTYTYGYTNGRLSSVTDPDAVTTTFSYQGGNMTGLGQGDKTTHVMEYISDSYKVNKITPIGRDESTYSYDPDNRTTTVTDPYGNVTTYVYDTGGNLVQETNALGLTTSYTYDSYGNMLTEENADGTTTYTYDNAGNLTSITDAMGRVTRYTYDGNGNKLTDTDPSGQTTSYTYDGNSNLTGVSSSSGSSTGYTYDAAGRMLTETSGGNTASYTYDSLGRMLTATKPGGYTTTYTYDSMGRKTSETDPLGNTTTYTYDSKGRVTTVTHPDNSYEEYTYSCCHMTSKRDANGNTTAYTYDDAGNL
ncbi:MAG: DUF6531 domain-containing protein, partial [bacterium]|nr:DUF6531 domain-containing protein [bacterium]